MLTFENTTQILVTLILFVSLIGMNLSTGWLNKLSLAPVLHSFWGYMLAAI